MEAFSLGREQVSFPTHHVPGGAALIESMGTGAFPKGLFAAAHALTHAHHVTAFAFSRSRAPRVLIAENSGAKPVSRGIANLYADSFWRHDLANQVAGRGADGACKWLVRTIASEIVQDDYKYACYTAVNLAGRVCVSFGEPEECTRMNFYSQHGYRFSESDVNNIAAWSEIFIAMLRKHASMVPVEPQALAPSYEDALRHLPERLPEREVEVCDGILAGISSEGIALKLNVSINTVRTYRKRAYMRLGISSQNELMRLVLRARQNHPA